MKLKTLFILAALGTASFGASADGVSYIVTYTGTVGNTLAGNYDYANLFGGGTLNGDTFTATFLVNPAAASYYPTDGLTYKVISGENQPGLANNPLTGTLTINGYSVGLENNFFGSETLLYAPGAADPNRVNNGITDVVDGYDSNRILLSVRNQTGNPIIPADFTSPFTYTVRADDNGVGDFEFFRQGYNFSGNLYTQTVSLSPVPEPATWMMFLIGFFGVGYMTCGTRRKDAAFVA